MQSAQEIKISKKLSYVLRHNPQAIGISLDEQGWVAVETLLAAFNQYFFTLSFSELEYVVLNNAKQRFAFSDDKTQIRANQGHSIEVDLGYTPQIPPEILYHGTATRFLLSIQNQGLLKQNRHHVHLSADTETAYKVGIRHGVPAILAVEAKKMHTDGFTFFISENGVWLTEHVPTKYLIFPKKSS